MQRRPSRKKDSKQQFIYGRHPIVDAINAGQPIDKILFQQGIRGEFEKEIRHLGKKHNIPIQILPKDRMNKVTGKNHQGIIAYISLVRYYEIEDVLPILYEQPTAPLLVILDGVTDVRNFGAIARTAECAGAGALIIPQKGTAQINAEAMKTAAGALSKIPVCRSSSLNNLIDYLKQSGIQIVASDLKGKKHLSGIDFNIPTAIIVGSEGEGVSAHLLRKADSTFIIPQVGTTDSYNVSVAAGMMLYEALRQRIG